VVSSFLTPLVPTLLGIANLNSYPWSPRTRVGAKLYHCLSLSGVAGSTTASTFTLSS
jgi:hypothetical protein